MEKINVETLKNHGIFIGLIEKVGYVYQMAGSYYSFSKNGINKIDFWEENKMKALNEQLTNTVNEEMKGIEVKRFITTKKEGLVLNTEPKKSELIVQYAKKYRSN